MLEFACPKCSETVKAAEDQAGESILCPKCSQTIRVPGAAKNPAPSDGDPWSVFDEDEKFIEESVAQKPQANYRKPDDDLDPLIDDDEAAAKQEEAEEKAAVTEALERNRSNDSSSETSGSSNLTLDEQMEQEEKFQKDLESLPDDSPLKQQKAWDRESKDTPDSLRLENQPSSGNAIGVKCPVCESVTLVSEHKAGTRIVCSDCDTPIDVPSAKDQPQKERKLQEWEKWAQKDKEEHEKKQKSRIVDELFVAPPEEGDEEGYGLAPAPEDLLTPIVPVVELTGEDAADQMVGEESLMEEEDDQRRRRSSAQPSAEEGDEPPPAEREVSPLETSALFEEMEAEKSVKFERLPWAKHIFGILSDPGFLIRAITSAAVMVVGYSIFYFSSGLAEMDGDRMAKVASFLGKFMRMWSFPFLPIGFLMVCWVGQKVLNSTIIGDKKLPDLEGTTLLEWVSNSLFVGVGLGIGIVPGALFGGLLWTQFEEWQGFWCVMALGTISGMVVAPMIILSSLQNQNPFKIFSQKISDSVRAKTDAWIEFYLPCIGLSIITGCLWLLAMTEVWIVVVLMIVLVNLGLGFYFRMLGRLMGTIVSRPGSKRKKSTEEQDA